MLDWGHMLAISLNLDLIYKSVPGEKQKCGELAFRGWLVLNQLISNSNMRTLFITKMFLFVWYILNLYFNFFFWFLFCRKMIGKIQARVTFGET